MHRQEYWEALLFWFGGGVIFEKDGGRTVQYNDTRDVNERATYCKIHQFFPINDVENNLWVVGCLHNQAGYKTGQISHTN